MENKNRPKPSLLHSRLLKATSEMISKQGLNKLTMRALSQRVGVSRTAPYRHFLNKHDLLCAVAEEGFKELLTLYQEIDNDKTINAAARFQKIGMAYIEYAIKNPGPYRLMFGHELIQQQRTPGLLAAAKATFHAFLEAANTFQKENRVKPDNLMALTNISWITVHGLADLLIEDQFRFDDEVHGVPSLLNEKKRQEKNRDQIKIEFAKSTFADLMTMFLADEEF